MVLLPSPERETMKPIRVDEDERGALALEMTPEASRYAREAEREAEQWARMEDRARRQRGVRRDRAAFRFLRFLRDGGVR
jgi:hypothetical protein